MVFHLLVQALVQEQEQMLLVVLLIHVLKE